MSFGGNWVYDMDCGKKRNQHPPFLRDNSVRCQAEDIQPSVADQAIVGRRCNGDFGIKKWGVLHSVAIEALGTVLEHICQLTIIRRKAILKGKAKINALFEIFSLVMLYFFEVLQK